MNGRSAKRLSKTSIPSWRGDWRRVKPDLLIARQGIKLKFNDFQLTTQEHVWPRLNKEDLIATAHKAWDERRGWTGRAPGWAPRDVARSAAGKAALLGI